MKKIIIVFGLLLMCTANIIAEDNQTTNISYEVQAEVNFYNGDVIITQLCSVGDKLIEPSHTDKPGYKFIGWTYNDRIWDFENDTVKEHMTLTATYIPINITGTINNITDPSDNYVNASLYIKDEDVILSNQDYLDIASGYQMDIKLVVKALDESDVDPAIEASMLQDIKDDGNTFGIFFDANIIKTTNGRSEYITQTNNKVKIKITIPEDLRKSDRIYSIYRNHNGAVEKVFEGEADSEWTITIETDQFSVYAIAYKDREPIVNIPPAVKPVVDTAAMIVNTMKQQYTFKYLAVFGILIAMVPLLKKKNK